MERELWKIVYTKLKVVARRFHQRYVQLQAWRIAAVLVWAALHDRPICWACNKRNWSTTRLKPGRLPSEATMSRRVRKTSFALFLTALTTELKGPDPPAWELVVDGKPLPVGKCSKDRDARPNQHGKGYKLHAIWGQKCLPEAWEVGHGYQSPYRLRALRLFSEGLGWDLYSHRTSIERRFGNLGVFGGGLAPLPNWIRRLGRVTRWVCCKLIINAARIIHNQQDR